MSDSIQEWMAAIARQEEQVKLARSQLVHEYVILNTMKKELHQLREDQGALNAMS